MPVNFEYGYEKSVGNFNSSRPTNPEGAILRSEVEQRKINSGNEGGGGERGDLQEETRVGDIVVKLGARKVTKEITKSQTEVDGLFPGNQGCGRCQGKGAASLVATITNGEAVPVVQSRIMDVGLNNLIIIPLGADKVFFRSMAGEDALEVVNNAKDFFSFIFSHWMRWDFRQQTYKRGAWVRLYGLPVHTWNVNFFKLCVFDCGTFLRVDSCSADKDRLDFARVLIATPELEIVNTVVNVLVDGTLVKPDSDVGHVDLDATREVNNFVADIADGLEKEFDNGMRTTDLAYDAQVELEGRSAEDVVVMPNPTDQSSSEAQGSTSICSPVVGRMRHTDFRRQEESSPAPKCVKHTTSCPRAGTVLLFRDLGVWIGCKISIKGMQGCFFLLKRGRIKVCESMKGRRRLPSKDRNEVLRILKKTERRHRVRPRVDWTAGVSNSVNSDSSASLVSCTNDWKHWVVMHGSEQVAVKDVVEVGKAIGVTLKVDTANRLSVLDRADKGFEKRQETCQLVGNQRPFLLCLLERKLQFCDVFIGASIWGKSPHDFSYRPSLGAFLKSGEEFSVANVYAPCDFGAKQELWNSLSARIQLLGRSRVCVCGDFNVVRNLEERRTVNGRSRPLDCVAFNRFIDDNTLIDLSLCGRKYTWFKGDGLSMSRLDKFLLSGDWCLTWPNCTQVARMRGISDHCPLVLSANEEDWGRRPSRMLKCWKDIPGYNMFVKDKWNSLQVDGWGGYVLKEKLKRIKMELKDWHKSHTQNLPSRIESLKDWLAVLDEKGEEDTLLEDELAELHEITEDIHSLSRLHTGICWQQSRSRWLKEGDANTKYFHSVLANRRRGNAISSLEVGSTILEGVAPIREAVVTHFASHFKVVRIDRPEVKAAVWDCDSFKSPGPDGINFGFIKDFWNELKGNLMRFIVEFHRNGKLTKGLNASFIALIPKVDSPQRLNDFRPISLVGSLYKILAKVLANWLRLVVGSVISETQSAFVKGRQILDGILIANEVVDEARRSKKDLMLFKVDFEKAYDSVDWDYLDSTGLRQGDPLSPFLFLLAAEGLHVLMEALVERNLFSGYSMGANAPVSVSHLQFADATLLMGTKSWANVRALRATLVLFESILGLKVNFNKSLLVGVNILDSWLGEAASALSCRVGKIPFLYLGLLIGGDPRRISFWEPVLDRLKSRLSGWQSRFLSFGGRLILLKSVLASLPVYAFSFFKAPSGKWCWRMLVERDSLWFRVLAARYGVAKGRLCEGGMRRSLWWRELGRIRDGPYFRQIGSGSLVWIVVHCSWCLSASDRSGRGPFRWCSRSHMASSSPVEGVHLGVAALA
ncbi:hypothetical protein TSUD_411890 [Trifolium subterraneum]|uniref:Reverse transcriptase domain-containing protein n=1 Tax=Trifolium subterraneum TaxID=3900 RepID=A0A2Z6PIF8_TRISU|nr:hypothetical protein TSUD_411890 [Trifolium subterraneum]